MKISLGPQSVGYRVQRRAGRGVSGTGRKIDVDGNGEPEGEGCAAEPDRHMVYSFVGHRRKLQIYSNSNGKPAN